VLLFAEGNSANEPGLRPLGKGTARIAYRAWQSDLDVQVLPLWLRYDTFHRPFMEVGLSSGNVMEKSDVDAAPEAMFLRQFNTELRERFAEHPRPKPMRIGPTIWLSDPDLRVQCAAAC
jgi:hypothetical protein